MSIQGLPSDVVAQIKSSIAITSLNGVVFELLKNSFDAGSTKVDISVDYGRGGCVVEDNGLGILPFEFTESGGLGKLYHSSKLDSQAVAHGGQGIFLPSLSSMALLSITSHHHQHRSHSTMSMHRSEVLTRLNPAPAQHHLHSFTHGTRVTVQDLFGSMPVRVKQRAIAGEKPRGWAKEWEELKRGVVMLALSWPEYVAVTVREVGTSQKMIIRAPLEDFSSKFGAEDLAKVCSILSQASLIAPDEKSWWVSIGASTPKLEISGTISLDPRASKHVQFISFGIRPITATDHQTILHEEINRLFANSAFGNEETDGLDEEEKLRRMRDARYKVDGYTHKDLRGTKKGLDRWPMFYINIQGPGVQTRNNMEDILDDKGDTLKMILELLQAMILEFLTKHQFRPRAGRGQGRGPEAPQQSPHTNDQSLLYKIKKPHDTVERPSSIPGTARSQSLRMTTFDPLGANIKLPSFRRSTSRPASPFNEWSRIKSGTAIKAVATGDIRQVSILQDWHLARPSTASPTPRSRIGRIEETASETVIIRPSSTPLISSDGKIIRRPFGDVSTHCAAPRLTIEELSSNSMAVAQDANSEELITWMNPVTKTESLINSRTGLTIPIHNGHNASTNSSLSSRTRLRSTFRPTISNEPSPWLRSVLNDWDNPVFYPTESSIPHASLGSFQSDLKHIAHDHHHWLPIDIDHAFKNASAGLSKGISRGALRDAEVISQVDKKFVLVKLQVPGTSNSPIEGDNSLLVIIDQHAADERIRIETLIFELCAPPPDGPSESSIATTVLEKPLSFDLSSKEIALLRTHRNHFANWGIICNVPEGNSRGQGKVTTTERLTVHSLPPGIVERCKLDPRLLIDLIRAEVWKLHDNPPADPASSIIGDSNTPEGDATPGWLARIHTCPKGIIELLNSRACRSAIMFNDELSKGQCEILVRRLAGCVFPFMCAHGRVSLVPLVDLKMSPGNRSVDKGTNGADLRSTDFRKEFRRWKEGLQEM